MASHTGRQILNAIACTIVLSVTILAHAANNEDKQLRELKNQKPKAEIIKYANKDEFIQKLSVPKADAPSQVFDLKAPKGGYMLRGGADAGGGGNVKRIRPNSFPYPDRLPSILGLAADAIIKSNLSEIFKDQMLEELKSLYENNKFKALPAIIVIAPVTPGALNLSGEGFYIGGHSLRLGNGEITFSMEQLSVGDQELAELFIHETLHQLLNYGLSSDEEFVEKLAGEILNNQTSEPILTALENGHFLRPGTVYLGQLITALEPTLKSLLTCMYRPSPEITAYQNMKFEIFSKEALSQLSVKYGFEVSKATYLDLQEDINAILYSYSTKTCNGTGVNSSYAQIEKIKKLYNPNPKYPNKNTTYGYREGLPFLDPCFHRQEKNGKWICPRDLLKLSVDEFLFEQKGI